jgi:hypothetical protein
MFSTFIVAMSARWWHTMVVKAQRWHDSNHKIKYTINSQTNTLE